MLKSVTKGKLPFGKAILMKSIKKTIEFLFIMAGEGGILNLSLMETNDTGYQCDSSIQGVFFTPVEKKIRD